LGQAAFLTTLVQNHRFCGVYAISVGTAHAAGAKNSPEGGGREVSGPLRDLHLSGLKFSREAEVFGIVVD
jgi:hypothetical protein